MPEIQRCFVVEASYVADAATARAPYRDEHIQRMKKLSDEGALVMAGAYEDLSASLLVFALADEESVRAVIQSDVYMRNSIWTGYVISVLDRVVFDG